MYSIDFDFLNFFPPFVLCVSLQPGSSLEQTHIFVLAHILRRPIIVYGVKYYKSFRGETLGYTRFQGELTISVKFHSMCKTVPMSVEGLDYLCEIAPA